MPPLHDIAHLSHVELRTPVLDDSVAFFTDYLGLTETGRDGDSVYLRAWDDYERTTVKLTAHATSGVGRTHLRAASPEALQRRVAAIDAAGRGTGWVDGDPGHGPTYLFTDPDGHELGIYHETEWYTPPAELAPALKNQAQATPSHGVPVRRLDHVNWLGVEPVVDRDFFRDTLGALVTEQIVLDDGTIAGSWTTFTNKGYDAVWTRDRTGTAGPPAPHRLRRGHPGGHPARRRPGPGAGGAHRDRAAQARHPADLLPLRLRARRQPHRAVQRRRPVGAGPRLAAGRLDRGRTGQGPGLGPADHRDLPHPRDAADHPAHGHHPVTTRIAVLGLGEAGSEIARDLVTAGAQVSGYDPKGITVPGVVARADEADAVADAQVVLSANSSHDALPALTNALPRLRPGTVWADLNTAAPAVKQQLVRAADHAQVVDVALMSPVPGKGLRTPMLVSGDGAQRYADLLGALGADVTVQPGPAGEAISRKLLRSVFYKGLAAAVVEALQAADAAGCGPWLRENISAELTSFDPTTIDRLVEGTHRHARRRTDEMTAAREQLLALGVEPRVATAARDLLAGLSG